MKKRFITAYTWLFGTTKKEAERVYKIAPQSYILGVIESFETNAIRAFFED
jgi:hypothetical protein